MLRMVELWNSVSIQFNSLGYEKEMDQRALDRGPEYNDLTLKLENDEDENDKECSSGNWQSFSPLGWPPRSSWTTFSGAKKTCSGAIDEIALDFDLNWIWTPSVDFCPNMQLKPLYQSSWCRWQRLRGLPWVHHGEQPGLRQDSEGKTQLGF